MSPEVLSVIGRTLSHYRILSPLGQGGMGAVFRAEDTLLGRQVALKFPHRDLVNDPEFRARFLREARATSALDHPNIVVLYDVCEVEGEIFIAMQCVEGRSLRERFASGAVPLAETLAIGRAIADALAHAHSRGVIHRDIKPENILLCDDGRVKVADFGTARMIDEARVTQTGALVGTLGYVPPEVLNGQPADARSDLYSLGVVLHELCSGTLPFRGEPAAMLYQIAHGEPARLPSSADATPELRRLIGSLLERQPDRRPGRAIEVAEALRNTPGTTPSRTHAAVNLSPPDRSLAVLPFQNVTGNSDDDYFCAGIAEDLLTDLLKIPDLRVASRTQLETLRGQPLDSREAGRRLGVATLLEGGVRRAGDRVRVTARLVRADTGYQLWAERYDRSLEDIFEVQADISRQIAAALRLAFDPVGDDVHGRRTRSPRVYDLRLRALADYHRMEEEEMRRAIEQLEAAVHEDPDYALGRADLAECCVQMVCKSWDLDSVWLARAETEARRALELAPALPEAYRALGHIFLHSGKPHQAMRELHRAVELDPRFADALMRLAYAYLFVGDPSRAEIYIRRTIGVNPENVRPQLVLGEILLRQRRMVECREALQHALARGVGRDDRRSIYRDLLLSYAWEGQFEGVRQAVEMATVDLGENDVFVLALRAQAAAFEGRVEEARLLLEATGRASSRENNPFVQRARAHMLIGDRETALEILEQAHEIVDLDALRSDPQLSALRGEARFDRLLAPLAS
ncbi:MAG: protein kinase [Candidatus Eisenbacteria bacterium]|nr:protein kinase [Candidatus Eisenbacteria bacterium]